MLTIKPGVRLHGIRPEMVIAAMVAEGIFGLKNRTCTITGCIDGRHSRGSLHYLGLAIDLRTRDLPSGEPYEIVNLLKSALGEDFDVVMESDHIHIEFQPKEAYTS